MSSLREAAIPAFKQDDNTRIDDDLSAEEKAQLRELCVLIVINEFLEGAGHQRSIADSQGK